MDRTNGTFERHLYDPLHPDKLSRPPVKNTISWAYDHITFIREDDKGKIWIGTFQGGLNIYDPTTQKVSYYGSDAKSNNKIADNLFWIAYKTRDNIMWISTWENNLYKVKPHETLLPHTRIGKMAFGLAEDDAHTLWATTVKGLIHINTDGTQEQFLINKDSSSPLNQMYFIEKDDNKFWVTADGGLYQFYPATKIFSNLHHQAGNANSLISDTVIALKKDIDNALWIGTVNGLDMMNTKTGTFRHYQNNIKDTESISSNAVLAINTDKNQNLWACTLGGLNRLNKQTGHFKRYLRESAVFDIIEDSEGNLWAGTDAGLFKYNKEVDNFLKITDESSVITAISISWITEDHTQNLWLSTPKGIIGLNKEKNNATLYGKNQGVNGNGLTNFAFTRQSGEVLFTDTSGYYNFLPDSIQQNVAAPIVTISKFSLNNITLQPSPTGILSVPLMQTKDIRLNYNQNTFSFEFTNIDFSSEHEDTRLFYMLQNYDNAWRKAGNEGTAYYFSVPPGKYIFKVKALNAAGIAAEKDITVVIAPPWWNTWWAYTVFILLIAGLIWAFIAYRSRKLKRENKILEEKVEHRTAQLKQSLENLKATQTQLIQSEKMASLGELTAGIAHEIQNPLNFVNNFSEVNKELLVEMKDEIKKGNIDEINAIADDVISNEEKINHHGKRADAIVKGMLQHSRSSNGVKEPTDINKLADEYLRLAYHGLRAKDKSFNATMKTDYDETIGNINIIPQDIGRVVLNLINNAFYAASLPSKGGFSDPDKNNNPTVWVSTKKINNKVLISVRDNGPGIPKKILDKIFQPFFTTKPSGQGTGLGLSLSYDIVKAHGGELKVETKEEEGSEFIISLPV
jgi:signal transduction histidine kinase/sugar lactone lactonase YvrE